MQISNAEWRIMKIIWMEGKKTSTDLIDVLSERF
ncbi:MAG: BlaI/MecI/CopY family transcriptional regulator, partial [Streptococcus sp.]